MKAKLNFWVTVALLLPCIAQAQITLTSGSLPQAGSTFFRSYKPYTGSPGDSGGLKYWTFNTLQAVAPAKDTMAFTPASSLPSAFADAQFTAKGNAPGMRDVFKIGPNGLLWLGSVDIPIGVSQLPERVNIRFNNPILLQPRPWGIATSALTLVNATGQTKVVMTPVQLDALKNSHPATQRNQVSDTLRFTYTVKGRISVNGYGWLDINGWRPFVPALRIKTELVPALDMAIRYQYPNFAVYLSTLLPPVNGYLPNSSKTPRLPRIHFIDYRTDTSAVPMVRFQIDTLGNTQSINFTPFLDFVTSIEGKLASPSQHVWQVGNRLESNVEFSQTTHGHLVDALGRSYPFSWPVGETQVNLPVLAPGVYRYQLFSDKGLLKGTFLSQP